MKRILAFSMTALAAAVLIPTHAALAQSESKTGSQTSAETSLNDTTKADEPAAVFEDRKDERLYRNVLSNLNEMAFAKSSAFIDEKTNDKIDWFIVGGSFLDNRTGELQANFATMQSADSVARKIVDFESSDHGRGIKTSWKVFDRYGGESEATNALTELEEEFETYKDDRLASLRRQQQLRQQQQASRSRSRRSRRGSC